MFFLNKTACSVLLATIAVTAAGNACAQVEGPQPTRILVRADAKKNATVRLKASDVTMEVDGKPVEVTGFVPLQQDGGLVGRATGHPVEVAVLIDDGLRSNFGIQLKDLEKFVQSTTGGNTFVGVGYMRNGAAYFANGFSNDPEVAVKSVRLPLTAAGVDGSPYFCLQELVKHWPTNTNAAHVVLMITNGIDRYNGSVSPLNQDSPYVDEAIRDAQRANVPVYSIYYGPRGINSNFGSFSGQGYLSKVGQETGGDLFNQGTLNPPSLTPFFREFQQALSNTYVATFLDARPKLETLRVKTSAPDVKLRAQNQVQAGPANSR